MSRPNQKLFIVILLLTGTLVFGCLEKEDVSFDLVVKNVNIINLQDGTTTLNQHVVVHEGKIIEIIEGTKPVPNSQAVVEGTDKFLMPALWDMHIHLQDSTYLNSLIHYGILGVRDMGGCAPKATDGCESVCPDKLHSWRKMIETGQMDGPDIYFAGPTFSGTGWPSSLTATTLEEVQESFATLMSLNTDFVKVYENIPVEAYEEIARLAKENHFDFVGHVPEQVPLILAANLGQKSIEHMREPLLFCFSNDPDSIEWFLQQDNYNQSDREYVKPWIDQADEVIMAMKENNTWFTPTMGVQKARLRYKDSSWIDHEDRKSMPPSVNKAFDKHIVAMSEQNLPDKKSDSLWWFALTKLVKRFNEEGIQMLAGSDAACEGGLPGYSLHEELWLMVEEAGLSPQEALQTATINPYQYFGIKNGGMIKRGFSADFILLEKNPIENIRNSTSILIVVKDGKAMF